jgi:hypothetical protein
MTGFEFEVRHPAPTAGQHTEALLSAAGYTPAEQRRAAGPGRGGLTTSYLTDRAQRGTDPAPRSGVAFQNRRQHHVDFRVKTLQGAPTSSSGAPRAVGRRAWRWPAASVPSRRGRKPPRPTCSHPHLILPFPPGGATDVQIRALAQAACELGQRRS